MDEFYERKKKVEELHKVWFNANKRFMLGFMTRNMTMAQIQELIDERRSHIDEVVAVNGPTHRAVQQTSYVAGEVGVLQVLKEGLELALRD